MRFFVTGGAGFVGSNLVDRLLAEGHDVVVYDRKPYHEATNLENAKVFSKLAYPRFKYVHGDISDEASLKNWMDGCEFVFHLAGNADVRGGLNHPRKDTEYNTVGTLNVLEAMRATKVTQIAFSSTGSVYGEPEQFPTPEDCRFPIQTSLYAASKLAAEALIQAYCEGYGFHGWIFRFVSQLGERYSHGHVLDFYKKLVLDPTKIDVLGDGRQKKSYIYIQDTIDAMLLATGVIGHYHEITAARGADVRIYNLGTDQYSTVAQNLEWICETLGIAPKITFQGGERGWVGDSPFILLDCAKMRRAGWAPKLTIKEAVIKTVEYLRQNVVLQEESKSR